MTWRSTTTFCLSLALTLAACSGQVPQLTPTPQPSKTSPPTATASPPPTPVQFGERLTAVEGGFSFNLIQGYEADLQGPSVGVIRRAGGVILSLYGGGPPDADRSDEGIVDEFVGVIIARGEGDYQKGEPDPITVGTHPGISYELTGMYFGDPFHGQAILVRPGEGRFLFGLAMANESRDERLWEEVGGPDFEALLASLEFLETGTTGICPVATDGTYGYTPENPVRVGGDAMIGPSRERAYLDHLRGPAGELVAYERTGAIFSGDTILDAYEVTCNGTSATIYLDEYSYEAPQAPAGFTCTGPFPLSPP